MKAFTIHEPYATAIAIGVKSSETRGHLIPGTPKLLGQRIAVHAGKTVDPDGEELPEGISMAPGCVVATATLAWYGRVEFWDHGGYLEKAGGHEGCGVYRAP